MDAAIVVVGVVGMLAGVVLGLAIATGTISRLRDEKLAMAGDIGLITEELNRLEAYSAELEREKAIAMESSDRWRGEEFAVQNRAAELYKALATEKRRAAALLGWNRKYRGDQEQNRLQCQP